MNLHPSHPITPFPYLPIEVRQVIWKHLVRLWRGTHLRRNKRLLEEKLRFPDDLTTNPSYTYFQLELKSTILEWNIVATDEDDDDEFPLGTIIQINFRYLRFDPYNNTRRRRGHRRLISGICHQTITRPGQSDQTRII